MVKLFLSVPLYLWLDVTRRWRLSLLAPLVVFLWFYLQPVGVCYTFERVPFDFIGQFFGRERDHYDRVAPFVVGVNAVGIAEILWRKRLVSSAPVGRLFARRCLQGQEHPFALAFPKNISCAISGAP